MKEPPFNRKITAKLDYNGGHAPLRFNSPSRPASPTKQPVQSSLSPPGFRPTAKVSSNATSARRLSSSVSLNNINKVTHSRPGSPSKPVRSPGSSIVTNPVKARVTARPASKSTTTSPVSSTSPLESRQRSSTTVASKLRLPPRQDRPRSDSVAPHHAQSTSALRGNSPSPQILLSSEPPLVRVDPDRVSPSAPIKIKSKVSGLAKSYHGTETDPARSLSPPWVTTRPTHTRPPIPSLSSSLSLNAPPSPPNSTTVPNFYPITTAAPAANPHRYPSPRRGPSPTLYPYQTFTPPERPSKAARQVLKAKVDPASIPLPPHSPPISALSLSSKSSVSRSSLSMDPSHASASTLNSHMNKRSDTESVRANNGRFIQSDHDDTISLTTSARQSSQGRDSDPNSEKSEHKARAAAKSDRKIADLEITNKSLLLINASLETTKNRQAKEIRDLKRKLRESRLILPPRAFRAVESLAHEEEEEEEGDDGDDSEEGEDGPDEAYARVKDMLEGLLESGRKALERTSDDFRQHLSAKVLNADEVRSWRDSGQEFDTVLDDHGRGDNAEIQVTVHLSPSHVAVPDSDADDLSEDEVERLTLEPDTPPPSHLPPIKIDHL
ncbi:uncharacterized protein F5891DRAFT_756863 [Suillus fuscotomentosus]|uniref:Uncharacterized protein n=1 Tax=Suillus fuscotomentosus TaxID=1912939 RepID=A0AAD4EGU4_9AGAM|nr:uncharacterized protein F5891DRAFT_756863 [Suillus fuscotomentosus]KAG1904759.1 hypothetical protein F5891DRAFT_756863 [Suillus fuscotomentosus]